MVVLAAAATWLGLEGKENLEKLKSRIDFGLISDAIAKVIPAAGHRRPYAPRTAQDTEVISLILPTGLAYLIECYANVWRFSKNDLCGNLLVKGLMIYMTGEKNLLEAIAPAHT
jgi:predicted GNAT superfamily acetyltransferase